LDSSLGQNYSCYCPTFVVDSDLLPLGLHQSVQTYPSFAAKSKVVGVVITTSKPVAWLQDAATIKW
jgi:hypothetical protein